MKRIFLGIILSIMPLAARVQEVNPDLLIAAAQGDIDRVEKLLDEGVNVDVTNKHGKTALMVAAELDKKDVVRELLKAGADPNLAIEGEPTSCSEEETPDYPVMCADVLPGSPPPFTMHRGWTALHYASNWGNYEPARLLLKGNGEEVAYPDGSPKNFEEGQSSIVARKTPLMLAAGRGDLRMVKLLLRSNADVQAKSSNTNRTALYYAVAYADRTGDKGLAVIRELKNNGAIVDDEIIEVAERRKDKEKILNIITDKPKRRRLLDMWRSR